MESVGPDALVAHAAWMRRLALALTGREADADDLVQEAYVAALRSPPDPDRPPRPWLAEVVRNAWRMRLRGERRRRTREESAAPADPPASPDALLDRAKAQRLLADCVVSLDEPFRRTLLLRYFEGLSVQQIAELEAIAAATVRWRLGQALARLRTAMDERAERRRWTLALAFPLPSLTGAVVMKTKTKVAIAAALLLAAGGGTALVVHQMGTGGDPDRPPAAARPAAPGGGPTRAPADQPPAPAASLDARPLALVSARAELDPAARQGSVEGRVVNWSTGAPVAGAEVALALEDGATTTITTDREGRFRHEPDRAGRVLIASITAAGFLPFAPEWGHSPIELWARPGVRVRDVVIYLSPAIDYTGVVVDATGKPVAGARVRIIDLPAGEQELIAIPDRFTTDRKGEFVFHSPDNALLEARAAGHGPGRARLDGAAQTSHRLVIKLPPAGGPADQLGSARIGGSVVDAGGQPLPGVVVRAEPTGRKGEDLLVAAARAVTGDDGRFALTGLDAGLYALEANDGVRAPAHADVEVAAGGTATARLEMAAGAVLRGKVSDARGEPVPAFSVVVFRSDGLASVPVAVRTVVDREGTFAVEGLAARAYRVQATAHAHAPSKPADGRAEVPPDRAPPVAITLPDGGTLTGIVKSAADGRPLENARVSVEGGVGEGPTPIPFAASAVTDAKGEFALRGLSPGRRSVFVGAYNHHGTILGGLEIAEGAALGPVEVVLTPVAEGEEPTVELAGIGAVLAAEGDALVVQKVLPGGGAEKAGLTAGDAIVSVDGAAVMKLGMEGSIQAIRGPVGSRVALAVRKGGAGDPVTMVVERVKIKV